MVSLASGRRNGDEIGDGVVLPHGLEVLAENLWWTWGALRRRSLRRAMVVARRSDDRLVIHDPMPLADNEMSALESLGRPAYIVVANVDHRVEAATWKRRFPRTQIFAPRGAVHTVEEVVKVDGIYEDLPPDDDVHFEMVHGVVDANAMIVRSADGVTVVLNGPVFSVDRRRDALGLLVATILGSRAGSRALHSFDRVRKWLFVKDEGALREDLERYAEDPDLVRLVVAGETVARGSAAAHALREAASAL